ncbi:ABC transporter ATP-binding protein [Gloeothece verrucosa]|uniref:ABC transporter related protein n=1 Tax=Gloeothece verrucosa (strain PCC 7822) TaxID=497965 RepID=E0UDB7_GLOV7|nr:ABC transporter ATP-binding protein [Gloeothece verrucosa]ADN14108.1 ABC transporter related protein [Gloeothece verrucosa PCC 7822]
MHLEIVNLYKDFSSEQGELAVLKEINMHLEIGELLCVVGASGSGKSTLLRMIAGLDYPTRGRILVDGVPIIGPGPDRGMVFQHYTLYPWMNIQKNVEFGLKLQHIPPRERREIASYYLHVVGLSEFAQCFPKELSGGMQQRVAIARALACRPKILLMDEPFGALDVHTKEIMQHFLLQIWQKTGCTILMITHDVDEAVFLSQRIYVLSSRPGTVQREISIKLPPQRDYKIKRQGEFYRYTEEIMDLLRVRPEEIRVS